MAYLSKAKLKHLVIKPLLKLTNVIKENKVLKYRRISPMEFTIHEGKGLLYWKVQHMILQDFIVVKLMSEDGCVQIKLISEDQQTQTIYNVCELPSQFNRTF